MADSNTAKADREQQGALLSPSPPPAPAPQDEDLDTEFVSIQIDEEAGFEGLEGFDLEGEDFECDDADDYEDPDSQARLVAEQAELWSWSSS